MWATLIVAAVVLETSMCVSVPPEVLRELSVSVCEANCTPENTIETNISCDCDKYIEEKDWIRELSGSLETPVLYCREDNILTLSLGNSPMVYAYAIEIKMRGNESWIFYKITRERLIVIDNLSENTFYNVRLWGVSQKRDLYGPSESFWIRTLPEDYYPQPVSTLHLKDLAVKDTNYEAVITWDPPEDFSCYYEFVWFGGDDTSDYTQKELRDPLNARELVIGDLVFDSNYSVAIMSKSPNWRKESAKTWLHFTTQSCLEVYNSLLFCVPPSPAGLRIPNMKRVFSHNSEYKHYDLELVWNSPKLVPDYYTSTFMPFYSKTNNTGNYLNVPGNTTKLVFQNIDPGLHFQITLTAHSAAGASHPAVLHKETSSTATSVYALEAGNLFMLLVFISIAVVLSIMVVTFTYFKITKKTVKVQEQKYFEELELKTACGDSMYLESEQQEIYKDEWEIRSCDLLLLSVLGEGAFGVVRKALLTRGTSKTEVAVKMLKDHPHGDEIRQFKQEIDIMKSVGRHPNIVSIIGCCLKGHEGPRLVVEYCAKGDLLTYLRSICDGVIYSLDEMQNSDCSDYTPTGINFSNKAYLMNTPVENQEPLQLKDLLSIARQISSGMEYLSGLRVVHRDLAARNVLVCADKTVKVSDFGLSRDVYKDNVYCKIGAGKLPLRWMAIESLTHQRYTTKSDVWSYGILLWEIFTLGGNPYPSIVDMHKLLDSLKAGERMGCPNNCSSEMYTLMLNCWKENPKDRPTFSEIRKYLEILLENTTMYLNLNISMIIESYHHTENLASEKQERKIVSSERYVKPI